MATNWGDTNVHGSDVATTVVRAMVGTFPAISGQVLKSVSVYCGLTHTEQCRLAIYQGGSSADSPAGATLVWQGITTGSGTGQWLQISAANEALAANTLTWIVFKHDGSGFSFTYQSGDPGSHDFTTDNGRYASASLSADETVAYPATWPADTGTRTAFWYNVYLTYDSSDGISASVGKSVDGWCGAVPVYGTLTTITHENYPYCRAKVDTPGAETFYVAMTWSVANSRFEGTIYPGSNLGNGCADPTTGSFTVTVQLSDTADFTPVDYSGATSFTTYITRRKTSKGAAYDYSDPVPTWNTDHWEYSVTDFTIYADTSRTNCAIALPFIPTTAAISNITVSFDGAGVSGGSAASTTNAWWWDTATHTLYVQKASITTTEVDVDITFNSDTDLWATRFDHVQTADLGTRLFYNGLFIANQYLTTCVFGGGHNQTGFQAESRAHRPGNLDISTDCMERVCVHVDATIRTDASGSYAANIKWIDAWKTFLISQDNEDFVVEVTSSSANWQQQVITAISCKRTQTFSAGKPYIKNVYEFTNNDSSTHNYPFVWQREQWLGADRDTNDRARYSGDVSDVAIDGSSVIESLATPFMFVYDTAVFASTGVVFRDTNASTTGIFTQSAFILAGSPYAVWTVPIADRSTTVASNMGFYQTFSNVAAAATVSITFLHFLYIGTSLADITSKISALTGPFKLEGVTKDKNGSILGACDCYLFKMVIGKEDADFVDYVLSDGSGNYSFTGIVDEDAKYFVIAWKDNTPHVFDVTDHVLVPVQE